MEAVFEFERAGEGAADQDSGDEGAGGGAAGPDGTGEGAGGGVPDRDSGGGAAGGAAGAAGDRAARAAEPDGGDARTLDDLITELMLGELLARDADPEPGADVADYLELRPDAPADDAAPAAPGHTPIPKFDMGNLPAHDPRTLREAMARDDWPQFRDQMITELLELMDTFGTFEPVDRRLVFRMQREGAGVRVLRTKWVFVLKKNADGTPKRYKARLVACETVKDHFVAEKWSPTIAFQSVRLIFHIAAKFRCEVLSLDVHKAYLRGTPGEGVPPVYLHMPAGLAELLKVLPDEDRFRYTDEHGVPLMWRCRKNLYGRQDAGLVFWIAFRDWLLRIGFVQSTVDPCLFVRRSSANPRAFILVGVYVDDTLSAFSSPALRRWFVREFESEFQQSADSGDGQREFLSVKYTASDDNSRFELNTPKLWDSLAERVGASTWDMPARSPTTPLPPGAMELLKAEPDDDNPLVPKAECDVRSIVATAAWGVSATRPGEQHAVCLVARYVHRPTVGVVRVVLHLCKYLLDHRDDVMVIDGATAGEQSVTYVDSAWGNDGTMSWFGYCISYCQAPYVFRSKLSRLSSLSSRDAEAIGAVHALRALLGVRVLLCELGFGPREAMDLLVDNMATVDGAHSERLHPASRHTALRLAFIRDHVRMGLVQVSHVATDANLADIFTKLLPGPRHARLRAMLMGWTSPGIVP